MNDDISRGEIRGDAEKSFPEVFNRAGTAIPAYEPRQFPTTRKSDKWQCIIIGGIADKRLRQLFACFGSIQVESGTLANNCAHTRSADLVDGDT